MSSANPVFAHANNIVIDLENPAKRRKYSKDHGPTVNNVHYGQLKLLLSEMYLLSYHKAHLPDTYVLVYVGSSPGYHIPILVEALTQEITHCFCYDKAPTPLENNDKFTVKHRFFEDRDAYQLAESYNHIVFVSDIRNDDEETVRRRLLLTATPEKKIFYTKNQWSLKKDTDIEHDRSIWTNMQQQQRWMEIMRPAISLLKFRLPWGNVEGIVENGEVEYNTGELTFQPFMTQRGTEAKLMVKREEIGVKKRYNIVHYEEVFSFHNYLRSTAAYRVLAIQRDGPIDPPEMLDDWDSTAMYFSILCYYCQHNMEATNGDILTFGRLLMDSIAFWVEKHHPSMRAFRTLVELREKDQKSSGSRHRQEKKKMRGGDE
jgi:hypothetical protein